MAQNPDPIDQVVLQSASRFSDHEGMSEAKIRTWLGQFDSAAKPVAAKVLLAIRYYSATAIRDMARQLVALSLRHATATDRARIFFVPVGGITSSAAIIARALRDIQKETSAAWQIRSMAEIENLDSANVDNLVFVDDFTGTGTTLADWWEEVEPIVLPKDADVFFGLLVMYHRARPKIRSFANDAFCVEELLEDQNVLSLASPVFAADEQNTLLAYCRRTGATPKYLRGFGACGLLVAFRHFCPNNSLPILWCHSRRWRPLFMRRSL